MRALKARTLKNKFFELKKEEERSPSRESNLVTRCALYHCATTADQLFEIKKNI